MMFITFRVFLNTDRKKLVVAPDLMAKVRRGLLTMMLDRGYVQAKRLLLRRRQAYANKQNTLFLSARDPASIKSNSCAYGVCWGRMNIF